MRCGCTSSMSAAATPLSRTVVSRAVASDYAAFCLTVDTAHYSRRERDIAKRYVRASRVRATGGDFQKGLEWRTVKLIKDKFKIPLVIKGIATAEDAQIALDHGVDWIYVSNHGGRQLDHGRGAMHVLPEIVDAVKGRAKIMVDGGFCRGSDIVKAIAMGADLVGIGRLQCWALAAKGEEGVRRMLELLEDEVIRCLGLLGVTEFRRARQILSAPGRADQPAACVQRVSAAGHRAVPVLRAFLAFGFWRLLHREWATRTGHLEPALPHVYFEAHCELASNIVLCSKCQELNSKRSKLRRAHDPVLLTRTALFELSFLGHLFAALATFARSSSCHEHAQKS